jgi:hypothetical protein
MTGLHLSPNRHDRATAGVGVKSQRIITVCAEGEGVRVRCPRHRLRTPINVQWLLKLRRRAVKGHRLYVMLKRGLERDQQHAELVSENGDGMIEHRRVSIGTAGMGGFNVT